MSPPPASSHVAPPGETKGGVWRFAMLVLLTLFVCIAILVEIVMGLPSGVPDAEIAATMTDIRDFEINLARFQRMAGRLPSEAEGLLVLAKKGSGESRAPFVKMSALVDTWGHHYQYRNPGKRHPQGVDVYSLGPDGKDGTEDDVYGK